MNPTPYNFCDYRCERCLETAECDVYKRLQQEALLEKDDPAALLAALQDSFRETENLIKGRARELGIDIDLIAGGHSPEEIWEQRRGTMEDVLFKEAQAFTSSTHGFLQAAEPLIPAAGREFFDDITWHHTVMPGKIFRALGWKTDGEIVEDARNSSAVAMKSLTICIMAFDELASVAPKLAGPCRSLSEAGLHLKEEIRKRFKP